jgi:hypothetical protein
MKSVVATRNPNKPAPSGTNGGMRDELKRGRFAYPRLRLLLVALPENIYNIELILQSNSCSYIGTNIDHTQDHPTLGQRGRQVTLQCWGSLDSPLENTFSCKRDELVRLGC